MINLPKYKGMKCRQHDGPLAVGISLYQNYRWKSATNQISKYVKWTPNPHTGLNPTHTGSATIAPSKSSNTRDRGDGIN